ncbi:hypothetical protein MP478_15515 [Chryseobacterium sp. WG14]|uniref:hypothetical protein n=1 Tax=unclassified Chryseobacterium TaxID=2593645 RepID=UPI001E646104|nr:MULTISPECIES: hypothetical protein [unclassified Chryseobacterium]MCQ9635981.1 hypothetical protein [Chryseobacterium sp. WG23]MCQ9640796.1 hypothetical protein [Chryseobacterium sp. WG14]
MEKTLVQKAATTVFSIDFDFTSNEQKTILQYLQENNYKLMGYKGASGPNQVSTGVPAWFAIGYQEMFGEVEIDYEPRYKVYIYNKSNIGTNTTIQMQALSSEIPLGTAVTFHQDGSFSTTSGAPAGVITVKNDRGAGTSNITIGLAAKVNGVFQPFCAFTCTPQGSVSMEPNEKVVLFAAQTNMTSGSVTGNATAPGCNFIFSAQNIQYDLQMIAGTYGIESVPGGAPVNPVSSGESLTQLLNIF